jgi:hypothetical protein
MVNQGQSLTWMSTDTASSIMNVINPDNVQNVIYQDFQAEENPLTHELIRTAGVVAAPVAAKPQVNQTIMPGLQFPMFQSPLTMNAQIQQQQPVLVKQMATSQSQMVQQRVVAQPQIVQQFVAQPPMVQQPMAPMVHNQAPVVVEETSPNTSPFGSAYSFLFSKN